MPKVAINSSIESLVKRVYKSEIRVNTIIQDVTLTDMTKDYTK